MLNLIPKQPMMIDALMDALIDRQDEALLELPKFPDDLWWGLAGRSSAGSWGSICDTEGFSMITLCRRCQTRIEGRLLVFWELVSVCIGFGLLSYWLLSSWVSWPQWANLASSVVGGIVLSVIYAVVVEPSRIGHITPTRAGLQEISRWFALKESLPQFDPLSDADGSDSLLPYAIAFDEAERWLQDNNPAPFWFNSINLQEYTLNQNGQNGDDAPAEPRVPFAIRRSSDNQNLIPDNDEAYHAFMSAEGWGLLGRSSRVAEAAVREQDNPRYSPPSSSGGGGGDGGGDGGGA